MTKRITCIISQRNEIILPFELFPELEIGVYFRIVLREKVFDGEVKLNSGSSPHSRDGDDSYNG